MSDFSSDVSRLSGTQVSAHRPPSSAGLDQLPPLDDPTKVQADADTAKAKKKVKDFMDFDSNIHDLYEKPSAGRSFLASVVKEQTLHVGGTVFGLVAGAPLLVGGAIGTGLVALTFGATSVVGLAFVGVGAALTTLGVGCAVLGIVQEVKRRKFNKEVNALRPQMPL